MCKKFLKLVNFALYTLLIVCMGFATIIEKVEGKESARETVYGSWWFILLWAILTVASLGIIIQKRLHKRLVVLLLHLSFVVILIGALTTHLTGEEGNIHLRVDEPTAQFINADHAVRPLPFGMTLTDFKVECYPGTDAVMDYLCSIKVSAPDDSKMLNVSMNNIGKYGGYRFYQSAYDSDGLGTQLLVSHDPYGIGITYFGYALLFISLMWTLASRRTRIRELYRVATRPLVLVLALGLMPLVGQAAAPTHIPSEIAHDLGEVTVHYNNRLCPLNTAATEFITKLSGKSSWEGYSADEIFVGWMIFYSEWENQKVIRVKSREVQYLLGITSQWACVRDFYTSTNQYKLADKANDTTLSDATRKAIREADEKIQVVQMFYNSEMLHIFPLTTDGKLEWYTPGSTELPLGVGEAEFQFVNHVMDHLTKYILVRDIENSKNTIQKIKLFQREKASSFLPSSASIRMEIWLNSLQSARWIVFLCLTMSLVLCILSLVGQWKWVSAVLSAFLYTLFLYLTLLLALRWKVSGHVPMSNGYETMVFMAWSILFMSIFLARRIPELKAFAPLVSSLCMLVAMLAVGSPQITPLMPVLHSPLLTIHVALVMMSYALFAIITLVSIQGLYLYYSKKEARLARTTAISRLLLYPSVALLSAGIFIGAIWANVSWGSYWSWDPKETWALITLMIYALPLHASLFGQDAHLRHHLYCLISFLTVLMTYFGVNYLLTGMHSYA